MTPLCYKHSASSEEKLPDWFFLALNTFPWTGMIQLSEGESNLCFYVFKRRYRLAVKELDTFGVWFLKPFQHLNSNINLLAVPDALCQAYFITKALISMGLGGAPVTGAVAFWWLLYGVSLWGRAEWESWAFACERPCVKAWLMKIQSCLQFASFVLHL